MKQFSKDWELKAGTTGWAVGKVLDGVVGMGPTVVRGAVDVAMPVVVSATIPVAKTVSKVIGYG